MNRRPKILALASGLALAAVAVPAYGAGTGTVTGRVTVNVAAAATACITLDTNTSTFPALNALSTNSTKVGSTGSNVVITNCGDTISRLAMRTSNLVGGAVTWAPVAPTSNDVCSTTNAYRLRGNINGSGGIELGLTDSTISPNSNGVFQNGDTRTLQPFMEAPCTGSNVPAAGTQMSLTITITAQV